MLHKALWETCSPSPLLFDNCRVSGKVEGKKKDRRGQNVQRASTCFVPFGRCRLSDGACDQNRRHQLQPASAEAEHGRITRAELQSANERRNESWQIAVHKMRHRYRIVGEKCTDTFVTNNQATRGKVNVKVSSSSQHCILRGIVDVCQCRLPFAIYSLTLSRSLCVQKGLSKHRRKQA